MAESIAPLPKSVIEDDRRLTKAESGSGLKLVELRWEWTLDESNPKRVTAKQYAKEVGVTPFLIQRDAQAHLLLKNGAVKTLGEAREKASMKAETFEATSAVAQARGVDVTTARRHYKDEVREVQEHAHRRAIDRGTSPREELPRAAKDIATVKRASAAEYERRKKSHSLHWIHIEGWIGHAKGDLVKAIEEALFGGLDAEERELLLHTLAQLTEATRLTREAIVGGRGATTAVRPKLEVLKGGLAS